MVNNSPEITAILSFLWETFGIPGVAAFFAYGVYVFLGKKWLDNKFSKNFEDFKHQQRLQMEQYCFEINSIFNRVLKIHEKEFEILSELWSRLQISLGKVNILISPLQKVLDLNKMNDAQINEALGKTIFSESEKEEIRNSNDKNSKYQEFHFRYYLTEVRNSIDEFHNYLVLNKIFLSNELFVSFSQIDEIFWDAVEEREIIELSKKHLSVYPVFKKMRDKATPVVQEIEKLIQKRLHYSDAE